MMLHHHPIYCRRRSRLSRAALLAATLASCSATALAVTRDWIGSTSTDWATKDNWSGGSVPGANDDVTIDATAPYKTLLGGGTSSVGTITLGSAGKGVVGGDLTIDSSSHLAAAQIWIGEGQNASGAVTITNASQLALGLGNAYVGDSGTGTLNINKGASLLNGNGYIGESANSLGTVSVDGSGTSWSNNGRVQVGSAGQGYLGIAHGAVVTDSTAALGGSAALGSGGNVSVSDPGSQWVTTNTLTIGDAGGGGMAIDNRGLVSDNDGYLGYQSGSNGQAGVQSGGQWSSTGTLYIGFGGMGYLSLGGGGGASANSAYLAKGPGAAVGTLLIDGAGSNFAVTTNLYVASLATSGLGILSVRNGGTLNVPGEIDLGGGAGHATFLVGGGIHSPAEGPGTVTTSKIVIGSNNNLGSNTLSFNHTGTNYTFAPILTTPSGGAGGLIMVSAGSTNLTADSSGYLGNTAISGGTLFVNGKLGTGQVTVSAGTLGGSGSIAGPVSVQSGGVVAPGNSPGTLTVGALTLASGAVLDYELGAAGTIGGGVNDLLVVNGNLALGGTLNIADAGGFGNGTYRLINYTGSLSGTLSLGTVPAGFAAAQFKIDTGTPGQVNLIVGAAAAPAIQITPVGIGWGTVTVGMSGGAQNANLTNIGMAPLTISSVSAAAAPFVALGGTCAAPPFTLAVGASCTLGYDFLPSAPGGFSSTIGVASNAQSGPSGFSLSGTGVAAPSPAATVAAPTATPAMRIVLASLLGGCGAWLRRRRRTC